MQTKIILTLPEGLTEQERNDLQYLMTDAFAEFAKHREPVEAYVGARHNALMGSVSFRDKAAEVARRVTLAKKLKVAAHQFEVQTIDEGCYV